MRINKVEYNYPGAVSQQSQAKSNPIAATQTLTGLAAPSYQHFQGYNYQTFTGGGSNNKIKFINDNLNGQGEELMKAATSLAKKHNNSQITQYHMLSAVLSQVNKYIDDLDSGKKTYKEGDDFNPLVTQFEINITKDMFKDKDQRKAVKPVIEKTIADLDKIMEQMPKSKLPFATKPAFEKQFVNDIYQEATESAVPTEDTDGATAPPVTVSPDSLMRATMFTQNQKFFEETSDPFIMALKDATYLDKTPVEEKTHLSFYDGKAENIWKNLAVGTNSVILYDKGVNPKHLVNSVLTVFDKNPDGFKNLKKDNTEILNIKFDECFDMDYIESKMRDFAKNKDKNYIIITTTMDKANDVTNLYKYRVEKLKETPENVKFIMMADKDKYYSECDSAVKEYYTDFAEVTVPVMNMQQAKKAFEQQPKLMEKIKKPFTKAAVDKCVEVSSVLPGNYPEKALNTMKLVAAYCVDKDKITPEDVSKYVSEAAERFKKVDNNNSVKTVLDTGITLKDMIGAPSTKKEAQSIVDRIKRNSHGTNGYIVYSQDCSVGAGRKYTAKTIAGEAKVPYVEINAVDFGTEKVSLFDDSSMTPEASMKKLFSQIKAQAETNPHKSAVLFIENFIYFSVGEMVSEYHEKAMSQLIREMNQADEQGFNIAVIGSTNDPTLVGEAAAKSLKFNNLIMVDAPGYYKELRSEILEFNIKKQGIKLAGKDDAQKKEVLDFVAQITEYFPHVYILGLLDKAKNVAKERGHKAIDKADFTEAYLQLTTGRPAPSEDTVDRTKIVTSHECGHALNLVVMQNLMKNYGKPWHIGNKVNFITLDPRGDYGGAVYDGRNGNNEHSFEVTFADLVCCFGGTSCENKFYGIDGSWGITQDMAQATNSATMASAIMGQGAFFGKKSLNGAEFMGDDDKERINADIRTLLINAQTASDLITDTYSDFIKEWTDKHHSKVGTGECLILGEDFEKELADWTAKQPAQKQAEFAAADEMLLDIIKAAKAGKIVM